MRKRCQDVRGNRARRYAALACLLLVANLAACAGCGAIRRQAVWRDPDKQLARTIDHPPPLPAVPPLVDRRLPAGTSLLQEAELLEAAGDSRCVDLYCAAACAGWGQVLASAGGVATADLVADAATYHAALSKLLITGQHFGRLDPAGCLNVLIDDQPVAVPVVHYGFDWTADDFHQLHPVGRYKLPPGVRAQRSEGLGVTLVVQRAPFDEQFHRSRQPFAATAVLALRDECETGGGVALALELYNPARCTELDTGAARIPLAGDQTATLAWVLVNERTSPLTQFLRPPAAAGGSQLVMLQPYQPGKIPVVFIHGLLSDPTTWIRVGADLNRHRWYRDHYQTWVFRYPTGAPFLVSAAALRRELNAAIASSPQSACDGAAQEMVLVGHSMGGLLAKLQVTDSGDALWNVTADQPLDNIQATLVERTLLREAFYFSPQPFVRQVVFIGTPHCGSPLAQRGIGRLASSLVRPSTTADQRHRQLVSQNPGVFAPWFQRQVPNSIDLLKPDHPLLEAIYRLPIAPDVQLHSVVGIVPGRLLAQPGDGVVSAASASHPGVVSELRINEQHEQLHQAAITLIELERILQEHLAQLGIDTRLQPLLSVDRIRPPRAAER